MYANEWVQLGVASKTSALSHEVKKRVKFLRNSAQKTLKIESFLIVIVVISSRRRKNYYAVCPNKSHSKFEEVLFFPVRRTNIDRGRIIVVKLGHEKNSEKEEKQVENTLQW